MNKKDVIYIEPNDDITDILANIKKSENKIVALVPPKKAGVLRSAVNFKLIAKTAKKDDKAIVLVTTDESLLKLAAAVDMPVAKTLQSKPRLPEGIEASEFGEKPAEAIEEEPEVEASEEEAEEEVPERKPARKTAVIDEAEEQEAEKAAAVAVKSKKESKGSDSSDIEEIDEHRTSIREKKDIKHVDKSKKVPNFNKIRTLIIVGVVLLVGLFGFLYWAREIAPAVKISVHVKAPSSNFSENIRFTENQAESDPVNGVFFVERKTIPKTAEANFEATGQVDKGAKASGTIQITRPKDEVITEQNANFSIPEGTKFTYKGKTYVATKGGSINLNIGDNLSKDVACDRHGFHLSCKLTAPVSSDKIEIVAMENGESYNVADSTTSGWTSTATIPSSYSIKVSPITGGLSKIAKQVSEQDVRGADETLVVASDSEMRTELSNSFGSEYVLIKSSFAVGDAKITTSPSIGEEAADDVKPKIIKEISYSMLAVSRSDVDKFITAKLSEKITGDQTQKIYSTGVSDDSEQNLAFFESYKDENGVKTAKLKSTTKIGPKVDEAMIADQSYGEKIGKIRTILLSINGVDDVNIDTSYFWVMSVPNDENKVEIELTVE